MRFGYVSMSSASGIRPDVVARELEERGFDSRWVPGHSHIPTSRAHPSATAASCPRATGP